MVLYQNYKVLTIKEKIQLERLKKQKRRSLVLGGIGTLCLTAALVNTIKLFNINENSISSESATSQLNLNPIVSYASQLYLQDEDISLFKENLVETKFEIEQCFEYYCSIYQINKDIVYQKAQELTNSFTVNEWVLNHNIPGTKVVQQARNYDSQELGILAFVRHMKQIPTDFGFTKEELATNQTYTLDVSYEEFTEKQCQLFQNFDSTLCQAIQYHETGRYSSPLFLEKNNPAGLIDRSTNDYWQFQNKAEGILELLIQLEYNFCDKSFQNFSIEEQIVKLQPTFCPIKDDRDQLKLNQYWISGITNIYHELDSGKQMSSSSK